MVCRLYPQIRIPGVVSSLSQSEQAFLEQRGLSDSMDLLSGGLERICNELAHDRTCTPGDLAAALSLNLTRRIDEILGTDEETGFLETLMDGGGDRPTNINDVLKRILFVNSYEAEARPGQPTDEEFRRAMKKWEREFEKFTPRASVETLRKWRATAQSLASENNPGKVAERYTSIDQDFSRIEELVHQAVQEFDEWVNNEVDRMRGN